MSADRDDRDRAGSGDEVEREDLPEDAAQEHDLPPPATYAGRRASAAGEEEPEGDRQSSGFTEDFDEIERELEDELDDEFAYEDGDKLDADEEELDEGDEDLDADDAEPAAEGEEPEAPEDAPAPEEEEEGPAAEAPVGEQTVEAGSVAVGDREEAREAALAGLRARTASKQAKRGTQATPATAAPPPAAPATPPAAPADAAEEDQPRSRAIWPRFLVASLVIVISMAAATSVNGIVYLDHWADELGNDALANSLAGDLTEVEGGDPQTILILGSDERTNIPGDRRSDTAILLHVDPDRDAMSLLSIPRDLKVNIPGVGVGKFNEAYSAGGPKLTLRTVKALTGIEINHVVNINFLGFADAVNAIDCVYIDVDRRYFIPPESGIAEIDISAGYQRLCGLKALQYVRYRHDDNDLVRAARQQDFLREARQKVPPRKLIEDRNELLEIFTDYTTSDINSGIGLLELLKTFLGAANAQLNEVHFPAELGGPRDPYVTASKPEIQKAIDEFLGVQGTPGPAPGGDTRPPPDPEGAPKPGDGKGGKKDKEKQEKPESKPEGPPMVDATDTMQQHAQRLAQITTEDGKPMIRFPIFYPTRVTPQTTFTPLEASRAFPIDGAGDAVYRGYKFVLGFPGGAGFTEYYGVSGTDWENPPILDAPSETRKIDGREYLLFYDGDRLRVVGWKQKGNSYWVNNTLLQTLEEGEMLSIATSMRELGQ